MAAASHRKMPSYLVGCIVPRLREMGESQPKFLPPTALLIWENGKRDGKITDTRRRFVGPQEQLHYALGAV